MIDHFGFRVRDLTASRRFYSAVTEALGLSMIENSEESILICRSADSHLPFIWIGTAEPVFWSQDHKTSASPIHFALAAKDRAAVERFFVAALAAGGTDNGPPGPRGAPVMKYFAAFVLDPDGNNIEAGIRE
jgi:catechol 2,3-dioxygenase-like lactoylglutathione lyase family enzyme